jgi:fructose-bisphosphate aldolase class II
MTRRAIGQIWPWLNWRSQVFMTSNGASGTDDHDFWNAIAAGITVVHINTEGRLAWRRGFDSALAKQPAEIVPYKILPEVIDSIKGVVTARLFLFSNMQRPERGVTVPLI